LVVVMMMMVVVVVVVVSTCMHTWAWSSTRSLPAQHALAHESCTQPCESCMNPAPSGSAFTRLHLSLHPILHLQIPCRPPVSSRVMSCRVVSCRVVSCRVVSCRVVSCRVVSCRVVSCRVCLHTSTESTSTSTRCS
jgi:hypothetical protein